MWIAPKDKRQFPDINANASRYFTDKLSLGKKYSTAGATMNRNAKYKGQMRNIRRT
jgi:hypothetical protein